MADEKRLIDAYKLEDLLRSNSARYHHKDDIIAAIAQQPTVEAIVPPVNIGQILWCNLPHSEFPLECRVYCICREERNGLVLDYFRCAVKGWFAKAFGFEDVGKTVFLTEAEALAKMDGGNEDVLL